MSAVVLLPLLLLAASTPALAMQCQMAGLVLAKCCCPVADAESPPSPSTISRESCCRLQAMNAGPTPTGVAPQATRAEAPVAIAIRIPSVPTVATHERAFKLARFAVPVGPPILQVKQAFLI